MSDITFCFTKGSKGMQVAASYDTGWNEGLQCGGKGGWTDEVALNDHDAAVFRVRNIRTGKSLSICGLRWWRGMTFSVVSLDETVDGFTINEEPTQVTVVCHGPFSIKYDPAEIPATS